MFVKFPVADYTGKPIRFEAVDVDAVIRVKQVTPDRTTLVVDDHNGGQELFRIAQGIDTTIAQINQAKLYVRTVVANDVAANQAALNPGRDQ